MNMDALKYKLIGYLINPLELFEFINIFIVIIIIVIMFLL